MNKIVLKILIGVFLQISMLNAASINVFSKNNNADIYLDKRLIGKHEIYNYNINPGSHLLEVKVNKNLIYSEIISVNNGEIKTITTDTFIKSTSLLPDAEADKFEIKRSLKSKGNIGFGATLGSIPGFSLGLRASKVGVQLTGLFVQNEIDPFYTYEVRGIYYLKDKIINKMPGSIYISTGYGAVSYIGYHKQHKDIMLGIEFSLANSKSNGYEWGNIYTALAKSFLTLDNMYLHFDIGYGHGYAKEIVSDYSWSSSYGYHSSYEEVVTESVSPVARVGLKLYF